MDFNEGLGIKLEICVPVNETEEPIEDEPKSILSSMPVKLESVEPACAVTPEIVVASDSQSCKNPVLEKKTNESTREADTDRKHKSKSRKNTSDKEKKIQNDKDDSSKNSKQHSPDKTIETVTHSTNHPNKETKKPAGQPNPMRGLLMTESQENGRDPIELMFSKLRSTDKVQFNVKDVSHLPPLTKDLLKSVVKAGDIDKLQSYMSSKDKDVLQNIIYLDSSLMVLAAQHNHVHMVSSFLSLGAKINAYDRHSRTALMYACDNVSGVLFSCHIL